MNKPRLIGLTGYAGVGKDTVAEILVEMGYATYAFAKPLKSALAELGFKEPATRLEKEAKVLFNGSWSYRTLMQIFGTNFVRATFGEDFWVDLAAKNINETIPTVITDVRFENEADFIRESGGVVWHVIRKKTLQGSAAAHKSEAGINFIPLVDVAIDNRGSLEQLKAQVDKALS